MENKPHKRPSDKSLSEFVKTVSPFIVEMLESDKKSEKKNKQEKLIPTPKQLKEIAELLKPEMKRLIKKRKGE